MLILAVTAVGCTSRLPPTSPMVSQSATDAPRPSTPSSARPSAVASSSAGGHATADPTRPAAGWVPLGRAAIADATWAPDSGHVLVSLGTAAGPPESNVVNLLDRSGQAVRSYSAVTTAVWLDADEFVLFEPLLTRDEDGDWHPETFPDGQPRGDWRLGQIGSAEMARVDAPLLPALSNGHGALAVHELDPPQTLIWTTDGVETISGRPAGWSSDGSKLALIHPQRSGPSDEGPFEVVGWPGLAPLFSSSDEVSVGEIHFSPAGDRVAYASYRELPHQPRQVPEFELTLNVVDLAAEDETAVVASENGGLAWLDDHHLLVVGIDSLRATIYGLDGSVADAGLVAGPEVVAASNGSTLVFYDDELDEPPLNVLRGDGLRTLDSPGAITGVGPLLAPDGSAVVLVVRNPDGPENPPATVLLHNL